MQLVAALYIMGTMVCGDSMLRGLLGFRSAWNEANFASQGVHPLICFYLSSIHTTTIPCLQPSGMNETNLPPRSCTVRYLGFHPKVRDMTLANVQRLHMS